MSRHQLKSHSSTRWLVNMNMNVNVKLSGIRDHTLENLRVESTKLNSLGKKSNNQITRKAKKFNIAWWWFDHLKNWTRKLLQLLCFDVLCRFTHIFHFSLRLIASKCSIQLKLILQSNAKRFFGIKTRSESQINFWLLIFSEKAIKIVCFSYAYVPSSIRSDCMLDLISLLLNASSEKVKPKKLSLYKNLIKLRPAM